MDLQLQDKVCLVTGGASGIGEAITRCLATEGAVPVILDLCPPEQAAPLLDDLRSRGHQAEFHQVNLTDESATAAAIAAVLSGKGRIDAVINNAGVNDSKSLSATPEEFRASLEKNLVQCFSVVHHALDALKASSGVIVNIASKVALTGQGGTSGYAAAKGGLLALTREWATELAADNIRVNAVVPAEVWTPMYERWLGSQPDPESRKRAIEARIPFGQRMTSAEEIADTTVFLLSPRSGHTTAQIVHVDGGYVHLDRAYRVDPSP